jgi:hypothetical protein
VRYTTLKCVQRVLVSNALIAQMPTVTDPLISICSIL